MYSPPRLVRKRKKNIFYYIKRNQYEQAVEMLNNDTISMHHLIDDMMHVLSNQIEDTCCYNIVCYIVDSEAYKELFHDALTTTSCQRLLQTHNYFLPEHLQLLETLIQHGLPILDTNTKHIDDITSVDPDIPQTYKALFQLEDGYIGWNDHTYTIQSIYKHIQFIQQHQTNAKQKYIQQQLQLIQHTKDILQDAANILDVPQATRELNNYQHTIEHIDEEYKKIHYKACRNVVQRRRILATYVRQHIDQLSDYFLQWIVEHSFAPSTKQNILHTLLPDNNGQRTNIRDQDMQLIYNTYSSQPQSYTQWKLNTMRRIQGKAITNIDTHTLFCILEDPLDFFLVDYIRHNASEPFKLRIQHICDNLGINRESTHAYSRFAREQDIPNQLCDNEFNTYLEQDKQHTYMIRFHKHDRPVGLCFNTREKQYTLSDKTFYADKTHFERTKDGLTYQRRPYTNLKTLPLNGPDNTQQWKKCYNDITALQNTMLPSNMFDNLPKGTIVDVFYNFTTTIYNITNNNNNNNNNNILYDFYTTTRPSLNRTFPMPPTLEEQVRQGRPVQDDDDEWEVKEEQAIQQTVLKF